MATDPRPPEHVDASSVGKQQAVTNPIAKGLNVTVSVPESLEIVMVDASTLGDYEVWLFIASLLASTSVGFIVAFAQDPSKFSLLINGIVFAILFLVALGMAMVKRQRLR